MKSKKSWRNTISRYFKDDIAPDFMLETELMMLALAAGINDATTFPDYRIFASNQTGNTALLAVGTLGLVGDVIDLTNVGVSLGLFLIGGIVLGQLGHVFGRTTRAWLLFTNIVQTILVLVAAALRQWYAPSITSQRRYAVVALLAFASGGQVAMARTVNIAEITTAMVTSAYIDFFVDPKLLDRHNRPRNRRLLFVIALIVGSFIGAGAYRKVGPALSLLLAGIVKSCVCLMLFLNHDKATDDAQETLPAPVQRASRNQDRYE